MAKVRPFFIVRHQAPKDVQNASKGVRLRYWAMVAELVLKRKDWELSQAWAADGKPLGRPSQRWTKRRRSRMTADESGDPTAPLFQPGNELSRVRSLLTAKALPDGTGCRIWWRFDSHTGAEFGEVLAFWATRKGARWNVVGLSPAGQKWVRKEAAKRWKKMNDKTPPAPDSGRTRPLPVEPSGRVTMQDIDLHSGDAAEIEKAIAEGRFSGWRTPEELNKWWREGRTTGTLYNPSTTAPVVRQGISNRGLAHTWEVRGGGFGPSSIPSPPPSFIRRAYNRIRTSVDRLFATLGI